MAGPGSDWSEEPVRGCEPAALDAVAVADLEAPHARALAVVSTTPPPLDGGKQRKGWLLEHLVIAMPGHELVPRPADSASADEGHRPPATSVDVPDEPTTRHAISRSAGTAQRPL